MTPPAKATVNSHMLDQGAWSTARQRARSDTARNAAAVQVARLPSLPNESGSRSNVATVMPPSPLVASRRRATRAPKA